MFSCHTYRYLLHNCIAVVVHRTADQQVEQSILHLGHDSYRNSSHLPMLSPAQYSLTVQNFGPKHRSFHLLEQDNQCVLCVVLCDYMICFYGAFKLYDWII